jgi:hypothetical protein
MGVYVGMDMHRKRSQVAVVDEAGVPQRNRNVPNDPAKLVPILGALASGTPWPLRPPTAGAGWWSCWRSFSWNRIWSIPAAARPSPRPGSRTTRWMRPPSHNCCGPTCYPRPGSHPRQPGICGRCCAIGPAWSG